MSEFVFQAADERDTDRLGAALAAAAPPGATIALCGTLGAGKTRLVQAIAAACGVPRCDVVSPTFVLCQEYRGSRTIYHLDAYRVRELDELRELGLDEIMATDALKIIEWADRISAALPDSYLQIDISVTGPTSRLFTINAHGNGMLSAIAAIHAALATPPSPSGRGPA
jgi:tRNA threonylcarbamoyladenosine biosynthesis protein TsaE